MEQNQSVTKSVLDLIGDTELLKLGRIAPDDCAKIYLKMESGNPTGSMKDRMALAMIEAAEASGKLEPGGRIVDYTGGTTGVSGHLACADLSRQRVSADAGDIGCVQSGETAGAVRFHRDCHVRYRHEVSHHGAVRRAVRSPARST